MNTLAELIDKGELERILRKYFNSYAQSKNDWGKVHAEFEHVVKGGIPPPQRQYKMNGAAENDSRETIKEPTEQGVIRKLRKDESAPTNAPIQAVSKPDGSWRLVTNYKALNKVPVPDMRYLINFSKTCGDIGRDKNWLSKIDLANGYWSIPLAEESCGKTAFTFDGDQFVYRFLPQGNRNAGNVFQSSVLEILAGLPVTVYIDDILIATSREDEHLKLLDQTLGRIVSAGLKRSLKKMEIGNTK